MFGADVLTLFPECSPAPSACRSPAMRCAGPLGAESPRHPRHGLGRHRAVDDTPAGGGPGMVLRADVIAASLDATIAADDPGQNC